MVSFTPPLKEAKCTNIGPGIARPYAEFRRSQHRSLAERCYSSQIPVGASGRNVRHTHVLCNSTLDVLIVLKLDPTDHTLLARMRSC